MENGNFDSLFSSGKFQMMKVLLPCLPEDKRGFFAVFIRMQELLYTMERVQRAGNVIKMDEPLEGEPLLDTLLPLCDPPWRARILRLKQTMHQMDQWKDVLETAQMMQELFPEGLSAENADLSQLAGLFSDLGKMHAKDDQVTEKT